jgi:hypothetical protein
MGTLIAINPHNADAAQRAAFAARYGEGAFDHLLRLLEQPCISFARIGSHFGVSRERVRQWQLQWLPGAPNGRQRRRLCAEYQQKRRLMLDALFRTFHRHARAAVGGDRIRPIRSRRGYQTRLVRVDHYLVALRDAAAIEQRYRGRADFVYFRLPGDQFLFVRQADAGGCSGTTNLPRNTFGALTGIIDPERRGFMRKEQSL